MGPYNLVNPILGLSLSMDEGLCANGMKLKSQATNHTSEKQEFYLGSHGSIFSKACPGLVLSSPVIGVPVNGSWVLPNQPDTVGSFFSFPPLEWNTYFDHKIIPIGVRKVKIQILTNYLTLAEVEVYDGSGSNIARGKNTAQSTTFNQTYAPGKAVDGDKNTYSHTKNDNGKRVDPSCF
jgi:hypothetical protein